MCPPWIFTQLATVGPTGQGEDIHLFDLRRSSAIQNLEELHRTYRAAA